MGNSSSMLTQYDLEELQTHCQGIFSQREIVALYERFCALDRTGKGFILSDEFMAVPEFALNPLAERLLRTLEGVNFKEFITLLSAFSARASYEHKVEFIFRVYDSDRNGKVTMYDILEVLRDLSGSFLTDDQRKQVVIQALEEAGFSEDSALTYQDFLEVLNKAGLKMEVEVPVD
ncbi:hypothetical protein O6H91_22G003200 [Diphasiastrum complanatum]|uniref:Uncharacterized protein n=1 Tax=Diphasiastrum complanatum TaxID=34168 RepID=A0ACC2AC98_DIPCM|nr:hypothetical protein O6H91_22G003200 [Diphasiastrum complanatum]